MKDGKLVPLCGVSDVAPGCALRVESGGCVYAVFNVEGAIHVTQDECTHGPGSLLEGYILDDDAIAARYEGVDRSFQMFDFWSNLRREN